MNLSKLEPTKNAIMYKINMHNSSLRSYSDHQMEPILFQNRNRNPKLQAGAELFHLLLVLENFMFSLGQ